MRPATNFGIDRLPEIYFIRHGETAWSLSGRHTGRTEIPLTAHGEDQARDVGAWLQEQEFSHVLTSPRERARRTCELAGLPNPVEVEPALAEWDYGEYEGRTSLEIRERRPGWTVYRDGCPGGETPMEMSDRADRVIANVRALEGRVALFSHGQFGCVLAARWIGLSVLAAQHFSLGAASLNILGYNPSHPEVPVIALLNAQP